MFASSASNPMFNSWDIKRRRCCLGHLLFAQLGNIIIEYVLKYNFKAYSSISKIVTYFHAYVWKTKVRVLWTLISIKNLFAHTTFSLKLSLKPKRSFPNRRQRVLFSANPALIPLQRSNQLRWVPFRLSQKEKWYPT